MNKVKIISLMLAIMLIASVFAGCGSTTKTSSGKTAAASTAAEKAQEVKKGKVELNFWHMWADNDGDMVRTVEDWNKANPDIHVTVLGNATSNKQLAAIAAGEGPDVAQCFWPSAALWGKQGAMEPLEKYIDSDTAFDKGDFIKAAWERVTFNGHVYAIPYRAQSAEIYYNKDLLAKAGYTKGPETIEELVEMAEKTTILDAKGDIVQLGFMPDYPWLDNVLWPILFGAKWVDDKGRITFDTPEMKKAYQWQVDLYKKYGPDKIKKFSGGFGSDAQNPFMIGKLAIMFGGEWTVNNLKKYASNLNYGVVPMPYPKDRPDLKGSGFVSPGTFYMNAKGKHKEDAWKFLSFLTGKEEVTKTAIAKPDLPQLMCRISALNALPKDAEPVLLYVAKMIQSPNISGFPALPYINEYLGEINTQMQNALMGKITVDAAAKAVQAKMEPIANLENAGK